MALNYNQFSGGVASLGSAASAFGSSAVAGASAAAETLLAQGSRLQGDANRVQAGAYGQSAEFARANRKTVMQNTALQLGVNQIQATQERRNQFLAMGATKADVGAAGLAMSGSAGDVLRSSAQQGEITQQLFRLQGGIVAEQGKIDVSNIDQQVLAYEAQQKVTNIAADESEISAQAHEANAAGLRSSASASKAGGILSTVAGIAQIGLALFCWVAREAYGEDNPRWLEFRAWLMMFAPLWFYRFYAAHGEAFAGWLRAHAWAKPLVRGLMNLTLAVHKARRNAAVAHA